MLLDLDRLVQDGLGILVGVLGTLVARSRLDVLATMMTGKSTSWRKFELIHAMMIVRLWLLIAEGRLISATIAKMYAQTMVPTPSVIMRPTLALNLANPELPRTRCSLVLVGRAWPSRTALVRGCT